MARMPSHLTSKAHFDSSAGSVESFASIGLTKGGIWVTTGTYPHSSLWRHPTD
jgi:hypothetical protein